MQWPEWKRPWLWMLLSQPEACLCVCVCFWLLGLRTSVRVSICASPQRGVYECVSNVCVCAALEPPRPAEVTETTGTDITVGGRGVSRQAAGYPITLAAACCCAHFLQLFPGRGQQRSSRLLPLSLSFHHLPSSLCWQQNFLFNLYFGSSLWAPAPFFAFSSCLTLPLWFSHLFFCLHLFPSSCSFHSLLFVSFCSFDSPPSLSISLCHFLSQIQRTQGSLFLRSFVESAADL